MTLEEAVREIVKEEIHQAIEDDDFQRSLAELVNANVEATFGVDIQILKRMVLLMAEYVDSSAPVELQQLAGKLRREGTKLHVNVRR